MKIARLLPCLVMCVVFLTVAPAWAAEPRQLPPRFVLLQLSSLTLNPSSVAGGTTPVLGTVTLNQPAPSTGVMVTFRSSNPTVAPVPPNVIIQPGATSATFVVQTQPVAINPNVVNPNPPSVQISAQIGNSAPLIAQLTVLPPTLVALTLNPASVGGGSGSTGTVTISSPAPSGGLVLTLSTPSSKPTTSAPAARPGLKADILQNPVTVPQQVTIAAGATSASFPVTTKPVTAATTVQINAAWGVFVKKTATLTVRQAVLVSILFGGSYSGMVAAGNPITATVNLDGPAPPEGLSVQIQSGVASGGTTTFAQCGQFPAVPSTVTVAGGSTSASFPITTYLGFGLYYLQTSNSIMGTVSALLYVLPPTLTSNSPILPSSVKGGSTIQGTIQLTGPAIPANCGQYALGSNKTDFAQVPPYATFTPGTSQGTFKITTSAVATAQTVTISVSEPITGDTRNAALTIKP